MLFPTSLQRALRCWHPCELSILAARYEDVAIYRDVRANFSALSERLLHTLCGLSHGEDVDLAAAAPEVRGLVQRCERALDDLGGEFRRTAAAREMDVFLFASEDLAQQFCRKSLDNKAGKRSHMSETAILGQYLERLLKTGWGSDADMRWVIRRAADLAQWPAPEPAAEHSQTPAPGA